MPALFVNVTPRRNEISPAEIMSPPILFRPVPTVPSWMNEPPISRFAPLSVVNRPALVTFMSPPLEPTIFAPTPLMVRASPVKSNAPVRLTTAANAVTTEPAICVKLAAVNVSEACTVAPELTITAPRRVAPTTSRKSMSPAPAVNVSASTPAVSA